MTSEERNIVRGEVYSDLRGTLEHWIRLSYAPGEPVVTLAELRAQLEAAEKEWRIMEAFYVRALRQQAREAR